MGLRGAAPYDEALPLPLAGPARVSARTAALRLIATAAVGALLLVFWIILARTLGPFILPSPGAVWSRFVIELQDGEYAPAVATTGGEAVVGFALAAVFALPLGYLIGRFQALEDALAPYLAGSQAMPVVAIAPLLAIWLGFGVAPKIAVSALIAFFPMLATTAGGVRGIRREFVDTGRVFGAGPFQMLRQIYIPLSARAIFSGVKVAAALSVTGAVVGEFLASDQGLGFMIMQGNVLQDTAGMFVALLSLVGMGALAYTAVSLIERVVLRWEE